jgi:hypothetical protein
MDHRAGKDAEVREKCCPSGDSNPGHPPCSLLTTLSAAPATFSVGKIRFCKLQFHFMVLSLTKIILICQKQIATAL